MDVNSILDRFVITFPEWTEVTKKQKLAEDLAYINNYLQESPKQFSKFCAWQKRLLQSIGLEASLLDNLLHLLKEEKKAAGQEMTALLIEEQLNSPFSITAIDENWAVSMVNFHIALFEKIDLAAHQQYENKLVSDAYYITITLEQYQYQSNSQSLIEAFFSWQQNILEALGFEKISLIRFLVSIQLFVKDVKLQESLSIGIKYLSRAEKPSLKPFGGSLAELIAQQQVDLFSFIDKASQASMHARIVQDAQYHLDFLEQAIDTGSVEIFEEYIKWVNSTLNALGIETISLIRCLGLMRSCIQLQAVMPYVGGIHFIDTALQLLIEATKKEVSTEENNLKEHTNAHEYLALLLAGKRRDATEYIMHKLHNGMSVQDIYLNIFQQSQYEIGHLWEKNKISVAQEHYCTASTQLIMSMLYPHIFSAHAKGKKVVATCVGSELHEIGVRMVADFLEMDGWDTYYLGANSPTEAIIDSIDEHQADILAISVTLTPHVRQAKEIIEKVKSRPNPPKIIVGGYPFLIDDELWKKIGADGFAKSAKMVSELALNLLA